MNRKPIALLILFLCAMPLFAQDTLALSEAVRIALENNYEIRISKNDLQADRENVTLGNAGMLPTLQATVTDNNNIQNTSQTRANGEVIALDNAKNNTLNYGVNLGWTVFDGFRMFARHDQLRELRKLGEAELQLTIITRVSDVMTAYYELVQQQQQIAALDSLMVVSGQRVTTAQNRFTIGKASRLEVLNAQVDLNSDTTTRLRQLELYKQTKVRLNQLMARDPEIEFVVSSAIEVDKELQLTTLRDQASKLNPLLQAQIINKRVAELQLKQVKAGRYPTVSVNTGYNFSDSESSLGFTSQSSARGFNYGFSAALNLFDGFNQRRNERVARLQVDNSKIEIDRQTLALNSQLSSAYQSYLTNIRLVELEEKNETLAKQNLNITLEKFRIGTIPSLEFRTAQINYLDARVRYTNALLQAKLSEIILKELAGNLSF